MSQLSNLEDGDSEFYVAEDGDILKPGYTARCSYYQHYHHTARKRWSELGISRLGTNWASVDSTVSNFSPIALFMDNNHVL